MIGDMNRVLLYINRQIRTMVDVSGQTSQSATNLASLLATAARAVPILERTNPPRT